MIKQSEIKSEEGQISSGWGIEARVMGLHRLRVTSSPHPTLTPNQINLREGTRV